MKVYSRPLNDGEMFCTSIKAAKSVLQFFLIHMLSPFIEKYMIEYESKFANEKLI